MSQAPAEVRLLLGERPRLEMDVAGPLPAWITVRLPAPTSPDRPAGRFVVEPRLPETEVILHWSTAPGVPRALQVLTVTAGGHQWVLEQDVRHPERWREQAELDARRTWS